MGVDNTHPASAAAASTSTLTVLSIEIFCNSSYRSGSSGKHMQLPDPEADPVLCLAWTSEKR